MNSIHAFAFAALAFSASAADLPRAEIRPGWDWSLPEGVEPAPYSGFVTWNGQRYDPMITVSAVQISWRQLCPAPDTYDFAPVVEAIEANTALGMRSGLHLKGVQDDYVPAWVVEKYNAPVLPVLPLQDNQPWRISIVPPWHPDVLREYGKFIDAFAATGIAQREEVVYGYIHGISSSRGEEMFLRPQDVEYYERDAGLTPEKLVQCVEARIDGMLKVFKGVEYKLAWTNPGKGIVWKPDNYAQATEHLWKYAMDRGAGWRGGGVDFMNVLYDAPALGATVSPDGYALIDHTWPALVERRFRGDENEEYGKGWEWRFGPYEGANGHEYRHRICTLRALQLFENFNYVSVETLKLNPELNRYAFLTQGKLWDDSPDAWAYLREVATGGNARIVKNIERLLIQRDVEGSQSVAAEKVERFPISPDPPDRHYDFDARRTDLANGQDGLAFQLDEKFWTRPAAAELKVTYIDNAEAAWHVEYTGASGQPAKTGSVKNTGDNERKTATFQIPALSAARAYPGGMDFRLAAEGPGDLTVQMVRIIKSGNDL
ncbi:MAG: hypothetical protein BWZ10_01028 [candidate division BRC1 bacterium ADurb.BinA364]|nr:MAG: hypothetical protein BWZ10_01028 [candidate division BRC1 bacterium ADurb.BinA364]